MFERTEVEQFFVMRQEVFLKRREKIAFYLMVEGCCNSLFLEKSKRIYFKLSWLARIFNPQVWMKIINNKYIVATDFFIIKIIIYMYAVILPRNPFTEYFF